MSLSLKSILSISKSMTTGECIARINQIRTKIYLRYISGNKPIPDRLARCFMQLLHGGTVAAIEEIRSSLSWNIGELSSLRSNYPPESEWSAFITTVISAKELPILHPPLIKPQQNPPIISVRPPVIHPVDYQDADDTDEQSHSEEEDQNSSLDCIGKNLREIEFSAPRDFSGISNTWKYFQPVELETATRILIDDLNGEYHQEAFASLVAIFTRVRPRRYREIPLSAQDPALSALNHFLKCFKFDLFTIRHTDPASAARRYPVLQWSDF